MTAFAVNFVELVPLRLLLTLVGVGLLFGLASVNGTTSALVSRLLGRVSKHRIAVPALLFLLTAAVAALGVGNIAATALVAPVALSLASALGLSPFLTSLLVIGGANAGALSPMSMTGILAKELLANLDSVDRVALAWRMFGAVFTGVFIVHGIGFLLLGGAHWMRRSLRRSDGETPVTNEKRPATDPDATSLDLDRSQRTTAGALAVFALLVITTSVPVVSERLFPGRLDLLKEPGSIALIVAAVLMAFRVANVADAIKSIPWKTVLLIAGMVTLSNLIERTGGLAFVAEKLKAMGHGPLLPAWMALGAGILSTFSSSSGVVMPLMLPMIATLASSSADQATLAIAIVFGAHLVDCSPLSSLGALCLAGAPHLELSEKRRLFRNLLLWGLAMAPVGAAIVGLIIYL